MNEHYRLLDVYNQDDAGNIVELRATTLTEFIPYVDGPLRGDMRTDFGRESCDVAIGLLRRERFDLANRQLAKCGCYLTLEAGDIKGGEQE